MSVINAQTSQLTQQIATAYTRPGQASAVVNDLNMATRAAGHGNTLDTNLSPEWQQKLTLLKIFNGRSFYKMTWDTINAQRGISDMNVTHVASGGHIVIDMNGAQLTLFDQAYSVLKEFVYDALLPQGVWVANDAMF